MGNPRAADFVALAILFMGFFLPGPAEVYDRILVELIAKLNRLGVTLDGKQKWRRWGKAF